MPAKSKDDFGQGLNQEVNHDSTVANQPGLYRHPETGEELIAVPNSGIGSAQADGLVRVGYEYVGPVSHAQLVKERNKTDKAVDNTELEEAKAAAEQARQEAEAAKAELEAMKADQAEATNETEITQEGVEATGEVEEDEDPTEGKSRPELNEMAEGLGLTPSDYKNRDHLAEAINEKLESQKES